MTVAQLPDRSRPPIPMFEGQAVQGVASKITGGSSPLKDAHDEKLSDDRVMTVGDVVHLVGEYRVVDVRHVWDEKENCLVRVQLVKPIRVYREAWDLTDPTDDGVLSYAAAKAFP